MESSLGGTLVRSISSRFFNFGYNICIDGYMCIVHGCINMYVQSVGTHLYPCNAHECNAHECNAHACNPCHAHECNLCTVSTHMYMLIHALVNGTCTGATP
jgi:hypothetical protein